MTRMTRFAVALVAAAGGLLATRTASAQVDCSTLPSPIYVTGSSAFGPTLNAFQAKLAMETPPTTVIYLSSSSCVGATAVVNAVAQTATGVYYNADGTQNTLGCTPAASTLADIAVSDVYYASCGTQVPTTTMPATVGDFLGPVQAMEIIVPLNNTTTQYLTAQEGQDVFGCGMGFMSPADSGGASISFDMAGVYIRNNTSGSQIITAAAINLDPGKLMGTDAGSSGTMTTDVGSYPTTHQASVNALGFVGADVFDAKHASAGIVALPFEAFGQTKAYLADSAQGVTDRRNVRDGHYFPWGYEHLLTKVDSTGKPTSTGAAKLIALITGTTTDATFDYVALEAKAGTIPLCAMSVQKKTDAPGYIEAITTPSATCNCAYVATATGTAPVGCTACTAGGTACATGTTCQHGYCE